MHSEGFIKDYQSCPQIKRNLSNSQLNLSSSNLKTYLWDLIKCPLCNDKITGAQMCSKCSKLFCSTCINELINSQKSECPACLTSIHRNPMVKCDALGKQLLTLFEAKQSVDKIFDKLQTPDFSQLVSEVHGSPTCTKQILQAFQRTNTCKQHQMAMEYYCQKCQSQICSDCAVLTQEHRQHKLTKLSSKRKSFYQKVQKMNERLAAEKESLLIELDKAKETLFKINNTENTKINTLMMNDDRMRKNIYQSIESDLRRGQEDLHDFHLHQQQMIEKCSALKKQIGSCPKSRLIKNFQSFHRDIDNVLQYEHPLPRRKYQPFQEIIHPSQNSRSFVLTNYSHEQFRSNLLYSDPFLCRDIEWRLKIYPGGLQSKSGENEPFFAIFVEQSKGFANHSNMYSFTITLINQGDRSQSRSITFQKRFEEGMCWGSENFISVSALYSQKFVHPVDDYLEIVLSVKPITYYHATQDQNIMIERREHIREHNRQRLRLLRKLAGKEGVAISKKDRRSWIVRALIDQQQPRRNIKRVKSAEKINNQYS